MLLQLANADGGGSSMLRYSDHRDMPPPSTSLILNETCAMSYPWVSNNFMGFDCDASSDVSVKLTQGRHDLYIIIQTVAEGNSTCCGALVGKLGHRINVKL
jgi:hypothetical protein